MKDHASTHGACHGACGGVFHDNTIASTTGQLVGCAIAHTVVNHGIPHRVIHEPCHELSHGGCPWRGRRLTMVWAMVTHDWPPRPHHGLDHRLHHGLSIFVIHHWDVGATSVREKLCEMFNSKRPDSASSTYIDGRHQQLRHEFMSGARSLRGWTHTGVAVHTRWAVVCGGRSRGS